MGASQTKKKKCSNTGLDMNGEEDGNENPAVPKRPKSCGLVGHVGNSRQHAGRRISSKRLSDGET